MATVSAIDRRLRQLEAHTAGRAPRLWLLRADTDDNGIVLGYEAANGELLTEQELGRLTAPGRDLAVIAYAGGVEYRGGPGGELFSVAQLVNEMQRAEARFPETEILRSLAEGDNEMSDTAAPRRGPVAKGA